MIAMKYIISFIVISALSFMNIGNCFAESAEGNGSWSDYAILGIIVVIGLLICLCWNIIQQPKKKRNNREEQEYTEAYNYDQNIVNQLVKNYLNSIEGKKLIEDFVRKDCHKIIEQIINERRLEKKTVPSPQKTKTKEQSQFVNTQTVNQGYAEKDSKDASMHSASAQQQEVALGQTTMTETHSKARETASCQVCKGNEGLFHFKGCQR